MPDASKPFKVRTIEGTLRSEHKDMGQATAAAGQANRDAERLGVKVRYRAIEERSGMAA